MGWVVGENSSLEVVETPARERERRGRRRRKGNVEVRLVCRRFVGNACRRRVLTFVQSAGVGEASGVEPEESEPCNYYCSRNLFYTSISMHTPFASSGSVLLSIRCLLPARCFAEFHESLSLLVLFRWSLRFLDTRHVAFMYVCMYVIGLVSCFVEQHFYFRFRVFFSYEIGLKKEIVAQEA